MSTVLLSFDIEEFDMPFEYRREISFEEQIAISVQGTNVILDLLDEYEVRATFFTTVAFALQSPETISRISKNGHELGSHGYYHSGVSNEDFASSKLELESIIQGRVRGFRMPRMKSVSCQHLAEAGYEYDSSLNPILLPGRYNNLSKPRRIFKSAGIIRVPASATPIFRIPLFWLSFHNFPLWFYKILCVQTMSRDAYLNLYFHPWEFVDITSRTLGLPSYVSRNSGKKMYDRFENLLKWMQARRYRFETMANFLAENGRRYY